jgi:hypothetical protein
MTEQVRNAPQSPPANLIPLSHLVLEGVARTVYELASSVDVWSRTLVPLLRVRDPRDRPAVYCREGRGRGAGTGAGTGSLGPVARAPHSEARGVPGWHRPWSPGA